LILTENPARARLRAVIRELRGQRQIFKIYCHRRAQQYFESIPIPPDDPPISENAFLHSLLEYRDAPPFDALVKFGPLRARGWGSAPDAVLNAPRFGTLVQIVWSGSNDDSDFGFDPVLPAKDQSTIDGARGYLNWVTRATQYGEDPGAVFGDPTSTDDLRFL